MLSTHRAGKVPGRGGLGSTEQKGPRHASCLWSQRVGDPTWEPRRLSGLEWMGQKPSSPAPTVMEGPSRLPLHISPASLLSPRANTAGRGLFRAGDLPGSSAGSAPFPAPLVLEGPSRLPLLFSPPSLLRTQDQPSPEGTFEGIGPGLA